MSTFGVEVEGVVSLIKEKYIPKLVHIVRKEPLQLTADQLLEISNAKIAKRIASIVARNGEKRFGPMWSEGQGVLSDGRGVQLQSSADALEILIPVTEIVPYKTHVRFDLDCNKITVYEKRQQDNKPIVFYNVHLPESDIPATLSLSNVMHDVGKILTQVEQVTLISKI
ncbi:hypothetical protein A2W13_00175 [Candidatus Woesebacteria bacterium RBG_16_36_11]|uniref:Uncharacterized protein n=2 Tax=Candidatus Woeseibacteriota TaxID=1752722 RepID=A0A1F7X7H8_9BACT|nr:MAG: hypothetical protein A2W13_00175 [Candidatus Woesebacteria bacterium RBG_16_36_11]OGM17035.1 MAG: hypothetical protein A2V55_02220 [Candidatus Woesebacteria bacterium RBG_19FT_COMBO_37_29]